MQNLLKIKKKSFSILATVVVSITVLWIICPAVDTKNNTDGHLSYNGENVTSGTPSPSVPAATKPVYEPPYNYFKIEKHDTDFDLSMHILEVDTSAPGIFARPVTSHETLFGYAYLSEMDKKWNALASVNGGFSHANGLVGGLLYIKPEFYTLATGQYPVLFLQEGKVSIDDVSTEVWLESPDGVTLESIYYNQYPKNDGIYVFTPLYGSDNRVDTPHLNAVISNNEVRGLAVTHNSCEIPQDGFLISALGEYSQKRLQEAVKPGMRLTINITLNSKVKPVSNCDWAYECGSWIIKDGEIVVPGYDSWVGTLEIRTPRTVVGIKKDGKLVFVVADGRQKGLSDGLTGKELALILKEMEITHAAFLDGGASSEMIIGGKIVNSPSAGRERMISSCFVIIEN